MFGPRLVLGWAKVADDETYVGARRAGRWVGLCGEAGI